MFDPKPVRDQIENLFNSFNPNQPNFVDRIDQVLTNLERNGIIGYKNVVVEPNKITVMITRPTRTVTPEPIIVHTETFTW